MIDLVSAFAAYIMFVFSELELLGRLVQSQVHQDFYPHPSYSKDIYYRRILFPKAGEAVVHDNYRVRQSVKSLDLTSKAPLVEALRECACSQRTVRMLECKKSNVLLLYTENMQSPTHVFRLKGPIVHGPLCNIQSELSAIDGLIVNDDKPGTLNTLGFVMALMGMGHLKNLVWGRHGDYLVLWDDLKPLFMLRIGKEIRDVFAGFCAQNPCLIHVAKEWSKVTAIAKIFVNKIVVLTKDVTPKSMFAVRFLRSWRKKCKTHMEKNKQAELKLITDFLEHLKTETVHSEFDKGDFRDIVVLFLQNLEVLHASGNIFAVEYKTAEVAPAPPKDTTAH